MTTDKDQSAPKLYTSEVLPGGLVIQRSNPDVSPEQRLDIIAARRMAQLTAILGPIAEVYFSKEEVLKY